MNLRPDDTFLDLGCGAGDYALEAAKKITGTVFALDINAAAVEALQERAFRERVGNLVGRTVDAARNLPLEDGEVDLCLMATVLHAMDLSRTGDLLFSELHRILKEKGRLAVIECNPENSEFGPPLEMRIPIDRLCEYLEPHGFTMSDAEDLGFNYLCIFQKR